MISHARMTFELACDDALHGQQQMHDFFGDGLQQCSKVPHPVFFFCFCHNEQFLSAALEGTVRCHSG